MKVGVKMNTYTHRRLTPRSHFHREDRRRRSMPAYSPPSSRSYSRSPLVYAYRHMVCRMPCRYYLYYSHHVKLMKVMIFKVFEHLIGFAFFELYESSTVSLVDSHLQRMIEHLGDFPPNFLADCSKRAEYFNDKGEQSKIFPTVLPP